MRGLSLDVQLGSTGKAEMIDHLELKTRKLVDLMRCYGEVLKPLGYVRKLDVAVLGYGEGESMDLFLVEGAPSTNVHFAFAAATRAIVDGAWAAGRDGGHAMDRAPALAPHIHPHY